MAGERQIHREESRSVVARVSGMGEMGNEMVVVDFYLEWWKCSGLVTNGGYTTVWIY